MPSVALRRQCDIQIDWVDKNVLAKKFKQLIRFTTEILKATLSQNEYMKSLMFEKMDRKFNDFI